MKKSIIKKSIFTVAAISVLTAACSGARVALPKDPSNPADQIAYLHDLKDARPDWTNQGLWEEDDYLFQVGQSRFFKTEREAKKHAIRDAAFRLSEHVVQKVNVQYSEQIQSEGSEEDLVVAQSRAEEVAKTLSKSVMTTISPVETFTEIKIDEDENLGFVAFATVRMSQKAMKQSLKMVKDMYKPEDGKKLKEKDVTVSNIDKVGGFFKNLF
jgi:antitoxin component of MazEF toxin-antitoxin module